ncbi:xylose isomerase [Candidatus Epulonipiscioides gigas]|nr:xylose isomerase [Epulopiscium sp. SCG-C07WGA-EpuloA2]
MKKLCHISTTKKFLTWFNNDWNKIQSFLEQHQLDGIELGLTIDYPLEKIPKEIVFGVHLSFYPMWIDFYKGDMTKVIKILGNEKEVIKYYNSLDKTAIINSYKLQFERAKKLNPSYLVFHVCHVTPEQSFSYNFDYTNMEVIEYTADLVNKAFKDDKNAPLLLFENLWWPGLTFLNQDEAKILLEKINYKHKGFVLDISHLTLTNKNISTEKQIYEYITMVINKLEKQHYNIKVLHLNKTLPKYYFEQNWQYKLEKYLNSTDELRKMYILKEHIKKLDPHIPFDSIYAKKIVDLVRPNFCVYETSPNNLNQFNFYVKTQNIALK